jgi:hypothetical protein
VVRVNGAGVCNPDMHIQDGVLNVPPPLVLGPEIAGVAEDARAYQAAAAAFARQDEADAAWVAADRAISAAELCGSPLEVIAGHFGLAHAFIRLERLD